MAEKNIPSVNSIGHTTALVHDGMDGIFFSGREIGNGSVAVRRIGETYNTANSRLRRLTA